MPIELPDARRNDLIKQREGLGKRRGELISRVNTQKAQCKEVLQGSPAAAECTASRAELHYANNQYCDDVKRFNTDVNQAVDAQAQAMYASRPRQFQPSGTALIGGTTWIHGFNVPPSAESQELRKKATEMFQQEMRRVGVPEAEFIDPKDYNFILGVASSYTPFSDLTRRVVRDDWSEGAFSAANKPLYASIRNRTFERLDCHSNGAMVCLAALELGDVKAKHVRLFGPQITPESLQHWQKLIERGEVSTVRLYINRGDPVPRASYAAYYVAYPLRLFTGDFTPLFTDDFAKEIRERAQGLHVKILSCPGIQKPFDMNCHSMSTYQKTATQD